jgi:aryl-alcohol dehydrogenase-like predicted oxidoreductase
MEYTNIPNLEQKISRIGLGTWSIGGWMWGGTEEKDGIHTIHQALDQGFNLIDTAPVYGFGVSEKIVGKALKQYGKRSQIVIATKVGLSWKKEKVYRDTRKQTILKEIEDSLRRLQIDYIDLYQVHWPDPLTPFDETAETLEQLLKEGKIRAIGVSNFSVEQMKAFQKNAPLHSLQSPFNLFERALENTELDFCIKHKIGFLGYGSLCRGLLTGNMTLKTQFKGDDLRTIDPKFQQPRFSQYLECVDRLKKWAHQKHGRSVISLAIRWALDKGVNISLWGARKPEQLQGIDEVWGWKLRPQDFKEIDSILKETISSPIGPEFMAPPNRNEI